MVFPWIIFESMNKIETDQIRVQVVHQKFKVKKAARVKRLHMNQTRAQATNFKNSSSSYSQGSQLQSKFKKILTTIFIWKVVSAPCCGKLYLQPSDPVPDDPAQPAKECNSNMMKANFFCRIKQKNIEQNK